MEELKQKMRTFSQKIRSKRLYFLIVGLVIAFIGISVYAYKQKNEYRRAIENSYNMAFYQLVDYVQEVEIYLDKSIISSSPESSSENLTYIWREANLAQTYLSMLPMNSSELENTAKFLNQVSDYTYSLYRKTIAGKELSQEDLDNLEKLHNLSLDLENTLNQLSVDINDNRITWAELTRENNPAFSQQVSNISHDSFSNLEENFHEYAGLIYDGAFSEHLTNPERKGLTGDDIDGESAKKIAKELIGENQIKEIQENGITDKANIQSYDFAITKNDGSTVWVSISKKGGHIVSMNSNRSVDAEIISQEQIDKITNDFLKQNGFEDMEKTYYTKMGGIETINYAYKQDDVIVYPDLIKLKVAMDNGEILGMETTGYLNSHFKRIVSEPKILIDEARSKINPKLEIESERLAIIPTEFKTEITCWEFKGKVDDRDFLVYVNVETGKEEDILVVLNSDEGTFTM